MTADALSQEEIDALLKGSAEGPSETHRIEPPSVPARQLEAVAKYARMMASTLGDMIGTFLASPASFTYEKADPQTSEGTSGVISGPVVVASFRYTSALNGHSALIFSEKDARRIGGTMVGDPEASAFADMVSDAFKEVVSTILGNLNTSLGAPMGAAVSNAAARVDGVTASAAELTSALGGEEQFVLISYDMRVGDSVRGKCWQLASVDLVASMEPLAMPPPKPAPKEAPQPVKAAPVEFDSLTEDTTAPPTPPNLELLKDIGLEVRVELGRSNMKIRDILKLGGGSVVELDKLAGEPVDLLVNDVIFAKGEVVVIDENFGVRITDILSLADRVKTLGERKG